MIASIPYALIAWFPKSAEVPPNVICACHLTPSMQHLRKYPLDSRTSITLQSLSQRLVAWEESESEAQGWVALFFFALLEILLS